MRYTLFLGSLLLAASLTASADIRIKDPGTANGKAVCEKGYFLIQADACLNQDALTQHSAEEIFAALQARKDPEFAKKYQEALAYKKANGIPVYKTRIAEEKSDILKLENGAIVEVNFGFVGFVGFYKKALLYPEGGSWKLWIEGKKTFPVELIKAPSTPPIYVLTVSDILGLIE